jgi:hypothetical protein
MRIRAVAPLLMIGLLLAGAAHAAQRAPVLVELFTSQGCNSCPPADAVLGEIAARDDVLALAFHITYWDRLGWKDTFGDERYTKRQRDYARILGSRSVYTPQAVVAGQLDVVGSNRSRILGAIDIVRESGEAQEVAIDGDGRIDLPALDPRGRAVIWAVAWDEHHRVEIARGENAGRALDYHHVVRWLDDLGAYPAEAGPPALPLAELRRAGRAGVAVVVQRSSDGKVLALGQRRI